ncbi:MAG: phosphoribosylaminoimidazolesuccinocarboxamide synthase [Candidatus Eisenbacteria bacterium]|nr:phosphoribosylaminoimidazolesuccinocarboxamide synthase [Candidatus Eisenbacteria bacterium]
MSNALIHIDIPGQPVSRSGKVRDLWDLGDRILLAASDRLSAFDCILPTGIPDKGVLLNQLSAAWFRALAEVIPTHFLTDRVSDYPEPFRQHEAILGGRSMLVRKAERLDIEFVVRGYLAGSGWADYCETGAISGHELPNGILQAAQLPTVLLTPAIKSDVGHDENITEAEARERLGAPYDEARRLSMALYRNLARYAESRGLLLADTKFEFGLIDGCVTLIDEIGTPDSSRYWDKAAYEPGRSPASFDKQFVRDWLIASGWNRQPPAPALPDEIVMRTRARYEEAVRRLIDPAAPPDFRGEAWSWN